MRTIDNILSQVLWTVLQRQTPTRLKKLTVCCPQAHRPQTLWNQKVGGWLTINLTTNQSEECPQVDHTLLLEYCKTLYYTLQVGHRVFRALACCGPLCLAKQQSYFFLLHPKLCLCISIQHWCRGWILGTGGAEGEERTYWQAVRWLTRWKTDPVRTD